MKGIIYKYLYYNLCFHGGLGGKESTCIVGDLGSILSWEDPLEEGMATHSSVLSWRIPWSMEPGGQATVHRITESQTQLK